MKHLTPPELTDLMAQATGSFSFRLTGGPDCWWYAGSRFSFDSGVQETVSFDSFGCQEPESERARRLRG